MLKQISQICGRLGITPVLIGGWAMNFLGVPRQTLDVDLMLSVKEAKRLQEQLERLGYSEVFRNQVFVRLHSNEALEIDILLSDADTLARVRDNGKAFHEHGAEFMVPSPEHLVAMKLHAMKNQLSERISRDLPDVVALLSMADIKPNSEKFNKLCGRYGTEKIRNLIMDAVDEK